MNLRAKLGITAAALTILAALLTPFVLYGLFSKGIAGMGLHVDEVYSGGPTLRTVANGAYTITVHRAVYPHLLQSEHPFVQLDWSPADKLPPRLSDLVDLDGDGQPDMRVSFNVPADPRIPLRVDVDSLNPRYQGMHDVGRERFSRLIVRVDSAIVVRVPLALQ